MIVGIDHIALSSSNADRDAAALEPAGFARAFVEKDITNSPAKRHLLRHYSPVHGIAYMKAQNGIAIELVQHGGDVGTCHAPYSVILSGRPPDVEPEETQPTNGCGSAIAASLGAGTSLQRVYWPLFHTSFWCSQNSTLTAPRVSAILLDVPDIDASLSFWREGMGFAVDETGPPPQDGPMVRLAFRSMLDCWSVSLFLVQSGRPPTPSFLDDAGFSCMALISNHIEEDLASALKAGGGDASPVFEADINGRSLRLAVFRGPAGEPVELIQPPSKSQQTDQSSHT